MEEPRPEARRIAPVPCTSCPWRVSTRPEDIPGGGMDWSKADRATGSPGNVTIAGRLIMVCHRIDRDDVCAGWVLSHHGQHSIPLRMAYIQGHVTGRPAPESDDIELHQTWADMRAAHEETSHE